MRTYEQFLKFLCFYWLSLDYSVLVLLFAFVVFIRFSILQYYAKGLAGKNVFEMTYFVSSGTQRSIRLPIYRRLFSFRTFDRVRSAGSSFWRSLLRAYVGRLIVTMQALFDIH